MRFARSLITIAALALMSQGAVGPARAACDEALAFRHQLQNGSTAVTRLNGLALKFRSPLAVNTDGAPNAYHIDGRPGGALNTLCNAGRAMSAVHGIYEGQENCEMFLADVKAAQQNGWHGSPRIVWHGIVTKDKTRHEPVVQNSGEYAGYFVSATSLQNKAFREDDQRRYLDARVVPSLVLPRQSAFLSDGGMKLGEASIALAAAIKGRNIDPKSLTGKDARKLVVPQQVVTVLFPGHAVQPPYDAARIAEAAAEVIDDFGGLDRLKQCAAQP